MANSNGYILFEGPSRLDGAPIVVIATGLKNKSSNRKTGAMVQTYILRTDVSPVEAIKAGQDSSICGDCPHRGDGTGKARTCYVNVGQGALAVWKAYKRGRYPVAEWSDFEGRAIRFGTYGDPMAAPFGVWDMLSTIGGMHTGYTHQWRTLRDADLFTRALWAHILMASVDTLADAQEAQELGFRTFRVAQDAEKASGEVLCPASEEAGRKLLCETCGACNGRQSARKGSIMIPLHGSSAVKANAPKLAARLIARG